MLTEKIKNGNINSMDLAREVPQLPEILDLKQLKRLLGYFSVVTGLDAAIFDFAGRSILANRKTNSVCEAAKNCRKCRDSISYGGLMSSELGEPYIFACGCGLIMCASPVMFGGRLIGSITCGPAVLWESDEIAVSEFMEKTQDMNISVNIDGLFRSIPSCDCINMTSSAQILFIIVNSLTQKYGTYLQQRARITEQQARIAELIIDQKDKTTALEENGKNSPNPAYPAETERELIALVQCGNREQAGRTLNRLLSEIFSFANGNADTIKGRLLELIAFFSRAMIETGVPVSAVNDIAESSFEMFKHDLDFEKACYLTKQIMERYIDAAARNLKRKPMSQHLAKAIDYITLNYADELTLNLVADAIFVSRYYLSHLFRKEMNTTFSDYVNKIRIDQAKGLLKKDRDAKIQEITEKAGFNDPNYFAKLFKKLTGVSPSEYHSFFK
jgi:two-component system response regulator YesN